VSTDETFARYRLGRRLGRGGMAEVHEASLAGHDGFVRKVALKRVRRELAKDDELVRMFSDEARIASHLHHGNLVAVLDYGVHEGVPYQALELVVGASLDDLHAACAREGRTIPEELAIHVAREIAHGLAYAHRAKDAEGRALGLVHRDVSPSNVLVSEAGDVKLTDFGIAFAKKREVETAHGVARGKPSYMAPEQATRGTLDARTDVFALGCTLHFALTGRSPLEGDAVLMKLLVGEPAPLDASLPDDLRALVAKAVSPDRRERHASAEAFAEALDAAYRRRSDRDGRAALRAWVAPLVKRLRDDARRDDAHEDAHEGAHAPVALRVAPPSPARTNEQAPDTIEAATRPETPRAKTPESSRGRASVIVSALVAAGVGLGALEWWSLSRGEAREVPRGTAPSDTRTEDTRADETLADETLADETLAEHTQAAETAAERRQRDDTRADGTHAQDTPPQDSPREGSSAEEPTAHTDTERPEPQRPETETGHTETERTETERTETEREEVRVVVRPDGARAQPPRTVESAGWARIVAGCERARDGAVRIDGRVIGEHVPTTQRLPAGTHVVIVETASGERFEGSVEITEFHTEGRPAWFRACQ
jgi:serine/threonine protein kinase